MIERLDGRSFKELRPLSLQTNIYPHADGSVLISMGHTRVLCSVTVVNNVPPFLRGKGSGWLTAEYAMLPAATHERTARENGCKRNGRSIEIARMIGRCLRTTVDLSTFGERTIHIDCDVLSADGGTRVAGLLGAQIALLLAEKHWLAERKIKTPICLHRLAPIAIGAQDDQIIVDLTYQEDMGIDVDYTVIVTDNGSIIEVQGAAERRAIPRSLFHAMIDVAFEQSANLFIFIANAID